MSSPPIPPHLDPWVGELARPGRRRPITIRFGRGNRTVADAARLSAPILSARRIAVVGLKGGTGKTTLSVAMASTYARVRPDNVLLFDADPRYGSIPLRTGVFPIASAHELAAAGDPGRVEILTGSMSRSRDGVWVLPSGRSATQSAELDEGIYTAAMNAVYRHFPIMVTDCGAGLATPLMKRVLSGSHSLVLATTATADGVLTTEYALSWLQRSGYPELTRRSVVALTNVSPKGPGISIEAARRRFASTCGEVIAVPADRHLAVGSYLDLDALAPATRAGCTQLAAAALHAALSA